MLTHHINHLNVIPGGIIWCCGTGNCIEFKPNCMAVHRSEDYYSIRLN